MAQHHIHWLLNDGIYQFTQWHRRKLHFFMLPHVLNFSLSVLEVMQLKGKFQQAEAKENENVVRKAQANIYDNKRMLVRYAHFVTQLLHVLQVKGMDDWYIGIMGMIRHRFGVTWNHRISTEVGMESTVEEASGTSTAVPAQSTSDRPTPKGRLLVTTSNEAIVW